MAVREPPDLILLDVNMCAALSNEETRVIFRELTMERANRVRLGLLIAIMSAVLLIVSGIAIFSLYRTNLADQRDRLTEMARSHARLIEAIGDFDAAHSQHDHPAGAVGATLSQVQRAHGGYPGFGETGEFTLARRDGDKIVFLLTHQHGNKATRREVSRGSSWAEPMRRALAGESGWIIGPDDHGEMVLAAYEPIGGLKWGIVATKELSEIRSPFIRTGALIFGVGFTLVVGGVLLFIRLTNPLTRQLQESEERLELAVRGTSDGLWDWNLVTNEMWCSQRYHELLGYGDGEFPASYEGWVSHLHPDDRARTLEEVRLHLEQDCPYDVEYRLQTKNGDHRWFHVRGKAVRNEAGQPVRMAGAIQDITERRRAKEEIERQNRFLNIVLESLDHPFLVIDAKDHSILMANKAARRHTPNEPRASARADAPMTCYALTHHRDTPCDGVDDQCPLAEVKRTGRPAKVEHVHYQTDGSPRNVEVHAYPVFDESKRVVQVIEYSLDVTERKEAEEELRAAKDEAEKARKEVEQADAQLLQSAKMVSIGQLAAGVAHEINNPIGFISSNLHSLGEYVNDLKRVLAAYDELLSECGQGHSDLERKAAEVSKVRDDCDLEFIVSDLDNLLSESVEGTNRVRKIVADLRDFSHVDSPDASEADINELLDKTINVAWNELKYKTEVVREYGQIPAIPCYGGKLGQVFLNLLVNAAHAIEERGTITVRTGRDDGHVWIEVEDTGCGMPPDVMDRVFDPFFTTKEVGKGTGMGLNLAYNIIESHGGRISVESRVGEGTTFRIELPVAGPPVTQENKCESVA